MRIAVTAPLALLLFIPTNVQAARSIGHVAGFLAGRDLVVEGRILGVRMRAVSGEKMSPVHATEYRIAISRVLVGVADARTLGVMSLHPDAHPPGTPVSTGQRVIAFGNRIEEDGWREWGGVDFIRGDGALWSSNGLGWFGFFQADSSLTPTPLDALHRLLADALPRTGTRAIDGAAGLAIVRLGAYQRHDSAHQFSYPCDSVGWAIPAAGRVPRRITFSDPPDCSPDFGSGVEMLLPVPAGARAESLATNVCPRAWVIHDGFVQGLGVPLTEIERALEVRDGRIHVREFLAAKAAEPSSH